MRRSNLALSLLFAMLLLLVTTACCGSQPEPAVATIGGSPCTSPVCGGRVFMAKPHSQGAWRPVNLSPEEEHSMKDALSKTKVADPVENTHVHAGVNNGRVVFSADNSNDKTGKEHVSGGESEVSLGRDRPATSSIAVKIVATPEAARLLQDKLR
jgi:hypothetical protein